MAPQQRPPRWRSFFEAAHLAYEEFKKDNGALLAAAISFYVVLSLIPMLLVGISITGYFLGSSQEATKQVLAWVTVHLLPTATQAVERVLTEIVQARGLIGGLGLLALIWSSMQGAITLQTAVNVTWRVPDRNFISSRLLALMMFLVLGFLLLLTLGITSAQTALSKLPHLSWLASSWLDWVVGVGLAVLVSTVMFGAAYRFFPNTQVRWRPALEAGFLAAVMWEIAKHAYAWYLGHIADFSSMYGPLGGLIGLVTWIYYSCFLVVFGSELARLRQRPAEPPREAEGKPPAVGRQPKTEE